MRWIARVFVFTAALVLGTFAGSLFGTAPAGTSLSAEDLRGTWKGNFGRNLGACTIEITRVEGDALYGTLEKEGALIRFEGYFNPKTRKFYFEETAVLRLAAHMGEWSLGRNSATVSADGRFLTGDGYDKWGQYGWAASNY
jgi:hypothetical protein